MLLQEKLGAQVAKLLKGHLDAGPIPDRTAHLVSHRAVALGVTRPRHEEKAFSTPEGRQKSVGIDLDHVGQVRGKLEVDPLLVLDLTGHQFRHLGGKFFLEENPGQYESVRQLLGHKHIKTTTAFYTGMNTVEATRVFDDVILKKRKRLSEKSNQSTARNNES